MLFDVNAYIATYFCNSLGSSCGTFVRVVASNTSGPSSGTTISIFFFINYHYYWYKETMQEKEEDKVPS